MTRWCERGQLGAAEEIILTVSTEGYGKRISAAEPEA